MSLIYILDDDTDTLFAMEFWLKRKGHSVKSFIDAQQLLQVIKETLPDMFLLDIHLNGEDGRVVCKHLKSDKQLNKPVYLMSTYTDYSNDFATCQADGFMLKPYSMKDFPAMVQSKIAS